ncbi:MAG TPA: M12 family metallo-peptidase [Phycisphaerales bacterium]|nr:M12 family metallo-peptidase [Phycisphaerales bacterium]HMP35908.1 M12 family metallo-peptidase [Phycisphaerales bacterium]
MAAGCASLLLPLWASLLTLCSVSSARACDHGAESGESPCAHEAPQSPTTTDAAAYIATTSRFAAPSEGLPAPFAPADLDLGSASIQALLPSIRAGGAGGDAAGSMRLSVSLGDEIVEFVLAPRSLRAPGFEVRGVDGLDAEARAPGAPATWRGVVPGRAGSGIAASIRGGAIHAFIRLDGRVWGIQPIAADPDGDAAPLHAVYAADEIAAAPRSCAGGLLPPGVAAPPEGGVAGDVDPCNFVCRIAFDADVEYFQANGSSVENTVADIEAILNAVELIYLFDTGISYLLTTVIVRTQEPDPYTTSGPSALLAQFRDHWNAQQQSVVRDVAHLMTGRNLNGSTIGIAYLSVVCNLAQAYGLTQGKWSNNFVLRVATVTHELGHNWSAGHCNADPECSIMCSAISGCSGVVTSFNPSTISTIVSFRNNASCLGPGEQVAPIANDDALYAQAGAQTVLDVLANDIELNCDPLTFANLPPQTAAGGSVAPCLGCLPGGRDGLLYTAPPGNVPTDSFSYTIVDPFGAADSANVSISIVELRPPENPPSTTPGLRTSVYLTPPISALPDFTQLTPLFQNFIVVLLNFPASSGEVLFSGQSDHVAAVFTGYLEAPTSDIYTLYLESSDGSRLSIGDQVVVDHDGLHGMTEKSGVIGLQAGKHRVRIEFFEHTGDYGLIGRWKSSTIQKGLIPGFWWSHGPPPSPADLNQDGVVNAADLGLLLAAWGTAGPGDLNNNGIVDGGDVGILVALWSD